MPPTKVYFYMADDGSVIVLNWLRVLARSQRKASRKCWAVLQRLEEFGYELRRPIADHVDGDIRELRTRFGSTNYRMLYAFHGHGTAIVLHAFAKEDRIPDAEIARAKRRLERFLEDPEGHRHEKEDPD